MDYNRALSGTRAESKPPDPRIRTNWLRILCSKVLSVYARQRHYYQKRCTNLMPKSRGFVGYSRANV
jgi:hypothetical protein